MLLMSLTSFMISFAFSIILATSPLVIGLWVLILALSLAVLVSSTISSWFGLSIFLIYIGGMLVMFAYFAALTPNQPHEMMKMILSLLFTFILIFIPMYSIAYMSQTFSYINLTKPELIIMSPWISSAFIMVVVILFFILVSVVKVADIFKGPLRPFY